MAALEQLDDIKQEPHSPNDTMDQLETTMNVTRAVAAPSISAAKYSQVPIMIDNEMKKEQDSDSLSASSGNDLPSQNSTANTDYSQEPMMFVNPVKKEESADSEDIGLSSSSAISPNLLPSPNTTAENVNTFLETNGSHSGSQNILYQENSSVENLVQPSIPVMQNNVVIGSLILGTDTFVPASSLQRVTEGSSTCSLQLQTQTKTVCPGVLPVRTTIGGIYPVALHCGSSQSIPSTTFTTSTTSSNKTVMCSTIDAGIQAQQDPEITTKCCNQTTQSRTNKSDLQEILQYALMSGKFSERNLVKSGSFTTKRQSRPKISKAKKHPVKAAGPPTEISSSVSVSIASSSSTDIRSDSEFLPQIEFCYSLKKLKLSEMMAIMDSGCDVMKVVKPGTQDYCRAEIFCSAARRHGISGIQAGIQDAFYASLLSPFIPVVEITLLKEYIFTTLKLRNTQNELQTLSEKINSSSDDANYFAHCGQSETDSLDQNVLNIEQNMYEAAVCRGIKRRIFEPEPETEDCLIEEGAIGKSITLPIVQMNDHVNTSNSRYVNMPTNLIGIAHLKESTPVLAKSNSIPVTSLVSGVPPSTIASQANFVMNKSEAVPLVHVANEEKTSDISSKRRSISSTSRPLKIATQIDEDLIELGDKQGSHEADGNKQMTVYLISSDTETSGDSDEDNELTLSLDEQPNNKTETLPKWNFAITLLDEFNKAVEKLSDKQKNPEKEIFSCYLCSHASYSSKSLHEHIIEVHLDHAEAGPNRDKYICTHCFIIKPDYASIRAHEIDHHLSSFPCYFCGIRSNSLQNMIDHICTVHGELYSCKFCSHEVVGISEFLKHAHQKCHHQPIFSNAFCQYCSVKFPSLATLKKHILKCHVDKSIPNKAECICYSCRHVFLDDKALNAHKKHGDNKDHLFPLDKSTLSSISRQMVTITPEDDERLCGKQSNEVDDCYSYSSKWTWWKKYLSEVRGVVRNVVVNGDTISYAYGEWIHTCEVAKTSEHMLMVLPLVMDMLVKITYEKFGPWHWYRNLSLTKRVQEMLLTVYVSRGFTKFMKSIYMDHKLCLFSRKHCTAEILIKGNMYKYPYGHILRYCAVANVNAEVMPGILDGLLRLVFAEFPQLNPSVCFTSRHFWKMVATVSRTPLFACLLESVHLKPLPWNKRVDRNIHSFLLRLYNGNLEFGDIDAPTAIVESTLSSSDLSSSEFSPTVSVNLSTGSMKSKSLSSRDSEPMQSPSVPSQIPVSYPRQIIQFSCTPHINRCPTLGGHTSSTSCDVVSTPTESETNLQTENVRRKTEFKGMLMRALEEPVLKQQMFDLKFWMSTFGMKGIEEKSVKQVTRTGDNRVKLAVVSGKCENSKSGKSLQIKKKRRKCSRKSEIEGHNLRPVDSKISGRRMNEGDEVIKQAIDHDECSHDTGDTENSDKEHNQESLITNKDIEANLRSFDAGSSEDEGKTEEMKQFTVHATTCNETEILPKWKKSILLLHNFNGKIEKLCAKNEKSVIKLYHCYLCSYGNYCLNSLYRHIVKRHLDPTEAVGASQFFICTHCYEVQTDLATLRAHEIDHHLSEFPCYFCGIPKNSLGDMLLHICKIHSMLHVCEVCKGEFLGINSFIEHQMKENHDHPKSYYVFYCLYCSLKCTTLSHLKRHLLQKHIYKAIPNKNERICYSCQHVFMDDQALKVHKKGTQIDDTVHSINPSTLSSLSEHVVALATQRESLESRFYQYERVWWTAYLLKVKDVVRTITVNDETVSYSYGDLVSTCRVATTVETYPDKLPMAVDKLVEIVLERFSNVHQGGKLYLSKRIYEMLSLVSVSQVFFNFLKSIDMEYKVCYLFRKPDGIENVCNAAITLIRGEIYSYPYGEILSYCSVEAVYIEIMSGIINGLVQLIFSEFPELNPCECFKSKDFYEMVATVSRTPLFESLLESVDLQRLPWNTDIGHHIYSFLWKCHNGKITLFDFNTCPAIVNCEISPTIVSSSETSVAAVSKSTISKDLNGLSSSDSAVDGTSKRSVASQIVQVGDTDKHVAAAQTVSCPESGTNNDINCDQSKQKSPISSERDNMLTYSNDLVGKVSNIQKLEEPLVQRPFKNFAVHRNHLLVQQMFDLSFWASKHGMKGIDGDMNRVVCMQRENKGIEEVKNAHDNQHKRQRNEVIKETDHDICPTEVDEVDRYKSTVSQSEGHDDKSVSNANDKGVAEEELENGPITRNRNKSRSMQERHTHKVIKGNSVSNVRKMVSASVSNASSLDLTSPLALQSNSKDISECTGEHRDNQISLFTDKAIEIVYSDKMVRCLEHYDAQPYCMTNGTDLYPKWNYSCVVLDAFNRVIERFCAKSVNPKGRLVYCYLCSYANLKAKDVYQHIVDVHMDPAESRDESKDVACSHCHMEMQNFGSLKIHELRNHLTDFPCYFCGIAIKTVQGLLQHLCHSHSEQFICNCCGDQFIGKNDFLQHLKKKNHKSSMIAHAWICLYCCLKFASPWNLEKHIKENHVDKPIPNPFECICHSCRHVFMDCHALKVHQSGSKNKATLYSLNHSILLSISKRVIAIRGNPDNSKTQKVNGSQLFGFKWRWWKEYVLKVKGVVRSVTVNGRCFSYPYGELVQTCKVTKTSDDMLEKLPIVFDKLMEITLQRFGQLQKCSKLSLTKCNQEMLSTIFVSGEYLDYLKSIDMENKLLLFCQSDSHCTANDISVVRIRGKFYKYRFRGILRFCAMENVNFESMPGIINGLLQMAFADFPDLDPITCIPLCDFWEMVATISRTPLFASFLKGAMLEPLPWNKQVERHIRCFLLKCLSGKIGFGDTGAWISIVKNMLFLNTSASSVEVCDYSAYIHEEPEDRMFWKAIKEPLLQQQMFDLRFWTSTYGMKDMDFSLEDLESVERKIALEKCRQDVDAGKASNSRSSGSSTDKEDGNIDDSVVTKDNKCKTYNEEEKNRIFPSDRKRKISSTLQIEKGPTEIERDRADKIRIMTCGNAVQPFCIKKPKRFKCSAVVLERSIIAEKMAAEIIEAKKNVGKRRIPRNYLQEQHIGQSSQGNSIQLKPKNRKNSESGNVEKNEEPVVVSKNNSADSNKLILNFIQCLNNEKDKTESDGDKNVDENVNISAEDKNYNDALKRVDCSSKDSDHDSETEVGLKDSDGDCKRTNTCFLEHLNKTWGKNGKNLNTSSENMYDHSDVDGQLNPLLRKTTASTNFVSEDIDLSYSMASNCDEHFSLDNKNEANVMSSTNIGSPCLQGRSLTGRIGRLSSSTCEAGSVITPGKSCNQTSMPSAFTTGLHAADSVMPVIKYNSPDGTKNVSHKRKYANILPRLPTQTCATQTCDLRRNSRKKRISKKRKTVKPLGQKPYENMSEVQTQQGRTQLEYVPSVPPVQTQGVQPPTSTNTLHQLVQVPSSLCQSLQTSNSIQHVGQNASVVQRLVQTPQQCTVQTGTNLPQSVNSTGNQLQSTTVQVNSSLQSVCAQQDTAQNKTRGRYFKAMKMSDGRLLLIPQNQSSPRLGYDLLPQFQFSKNSSGKLILTSTFNAEQKLPDTSLQSVTNPISDCPTAQSQQSCCPPVAVSSSTSLASQVHVKEELDLLPVSSGTSLASQVHIKEELDLLPVSSSTSLASQVCVKEELDLLPASHESCVNATPNACLQNQSGHVPSPHNQGQGSTTQVQSYSSTRPVLVSRVTQSSNADTSDLL